MDLFAPDRWSAVDTLFDEALARPPDERTAWLRARCGDDPALYRAVASMLEDTVAAERVLGESAALFASELIERLAGGSDAPEVEDLPAGTRVGPYRIDAEVGRGGMGTVYRAERADGAFHKEVALKLVKRGMDTDEVLRRFRYERQILAGLDHPGVARLLDAGAAPDGRPYLVMELVEGAPLTAYA
ncbi:MAG: protein kinase, partial [Rubricoccaceae bacterium]|nr:protein kinase [Rubricoccaceae bacterium]